MRSFGLVVGIICLAVWSAVAPPESATAQTDAPWLRVTGVDRFDTLNLRARPDPNAAVLARIPPQADGLRATGGRASYRGRLWLEIVYAGETGWASSRYLEAGAAPDAAGRIAGEGGRVALVIGAGGYRDPVPALANPVRDARLLADTLRGIGFEVDLALEPDEERLRGALEAFTNRARGAEAALFFFSGHGVSQDGQSQLVPVEPAAADLGAVLDALVPLSDVVAAMRRANARSNFIILDACRDTAELQSATRGIRPSKPLRQGLGRIVSDRDFMIVYATDPHNVAYDGEGANSPFTKALAARMTAPEVAVGDTMIDVRADVIAETRGAQSPWVEESLTQRFYFVPPPQVRVEDFLRAYDHEHRLLTIDRGGVAIRSNLGRTVDTELRDGPGCALRMETGLMTAEEMKSAALSHPMGLLNREGRAWVEAEARRLGGRSARYLKASCGDSPWPLFAFLIGDERLVVSDKTSDGGAEITVFSVGLR